MKKCELCNKVARMYCDSDEASLCWDCDSRVHTANFIVAKHTRTLLCHACQRLTSWTGSGPKLSPTVSVCEACVRRREDHEGEDEDEEDDDDEDEDEDDDDDEDEDEDDDDDDDDGENQVVPLSPPASLASTSSSTNVDDLEANARFSNEAEEKNGARNIRSWKWR